MGWLGLQFAADFRTKSRKKSKELEVFARNKKDESVQFARSLAQALRSDPKESAIQLFLVFGGFEESLRMLKVISPHAQGENQGKGKD